MICGREASTIGAEKGRSQIEDLRNLLGGAKRRTGREVVDVGSVEKKGERLPPEGSYRGQWRGGKDDLFGYKI